MFQLNRKFVLGHETRPAIRCVVMGNVFRKMVRNLRGWVLNPGLFCISVNKKTILMNLRLFFFDGGHSDNKK